MPNGRRIPNVSPFRGAREVGRMGESGLMRRTMQREASHCLTASLSILFYSHLSALAACSGGGRRRSRAARGFLVHERFLRGLADQGLGQALTELEKLRRLDRRELALEESEQLLLVQGGAGDGGHI